MNYRISNRLLQRHPWRAVLGQAAWCGVAVLVALPAAYIYGYRSVPDPASSRTLRAVYEDRDTPGLSPVSAPSQIASALLATPQVQLHRRVATDGEQWQAVHVLPPQMPEQSVFAAVGARWDQLGVDWRETEAGLQGLLDDPALEQPVLLTATLQLDHDKLAITATTEQSSLAAASMNAEAFGLPEPPIGSEPTVSGLGGTAREVSFTTDVVPYDAVAAYGGRMEELGWVPTTAPTADAPLAVYTRQNVRATLSATSTDDATLVSVILF